MFVPYRKFAASPGWLTAGPLVHRRLEDVAHASLDARAYDAVQEHAPLVYGWLRYEASGVGVVAEPEPGTSPEVADWLDPLLRRWAASEGVKLDRLWTPPDAWSPGE